MCFAIARHRDPDLRSLHRHQASVHHQLRVLLHVSHDSHPIELLQYLTLWIPARLSALRPTPTRPLPSTRSPPPPTQLALAAPPLPSAPRPPAASSPTVATRPSLSLALASLAFSPLPLSSCKRTTSRGSYKSRRTIFSLAIIDNS
jgi:hypothetical protein